MSISPLLGSDKSYAQLASEAKTAKVELLGSLLAIASSRTLEDADPLLLFRLG